MAYFQEGLLKISTEEIQTLILALNQLKNERRSLLIYPNLTALEGNLLISLETELRQRGG